MIFNHFHAVSICSFAKPNVGNKDDKLLLLSPENWFIFISLIGKRS